MIEINNISKVFRTSEVETVALNHVNLEVKEGEFVAIMGPSGCGKSTLLNILGLLDNPSEGNYYLGDQEVGHLKEKERTQVRKGNIGFVFQSFNLFPQYTALQNVMLAGQLLAKERPDYKQNRRQILADIETQAKALLAQMGLSDRENHYPHQLSGGQQQRVAIARALALHPDILCFDEPTSALDPELTGEVLRVLRELAEHKTTMIIVTHEMKFARDAADRILFMDGGVVVEQGDAKELIDHPKEERTRQFLASYGK